MNGHSGSKGLKRSLSPKSDGGGSQCGSAEERPIFYLMIDHDAFVEKKIQDSGNIFLTQYGGAPDGNVRSFPDPCVFNMETLLQPSEFSDATNFSMIIQFVELLEKKIISAPTEDLLCSVGNGQCALANALFWLGAYLILKLDHSPVDIFNRFNQIDPKLLMQCNEFGNSKDYDLKMIDWWGGLKRAKDFGWIAIPQDGVTGRKWGLIDKTQYQTYGCPYNGNIHVVVPDKFVVFAAPKNLGGNKFFYNYLRGTRDFSPEYFVEILRELGVTSILRFGEAQYDIKSFTDQGLNHYDVVFEDGTSPAPNVVDRFFKIIDKSKGLIAAHCKTGLGQTATMIALYLMRSHKFSAKDAIAWLRIMRPGSVDPEQQCFLHSVGDAFCSLTTDPVSPTMKSQLSPRSPRKMLALPKGEKPRSSIQEADINKVRTSRVPRMCQQIREELARAEQWAHQPSAKPAPRLSPVTHQKSFTTKDGGVSLAKEFMLKQRSFESALPDSVIRGNSMSVLML